MSAQSGLMAMVILLCFLCSAFFSGTESGVLSLNQARLVHLIRSGSKRALALNGFLSDLQRFLATILVGNNLVNVMLSTLSASLARRCFPGHPFWQAVWAVGMAFLMLFFCEYLPKLFFTTRPLRRTLLVARVFRWVDALLRPLTALVLFLTKWLVPKTRSASGQRFLVTREYIQNVVSDSRDGSRITAVERLMINRVLVLNSLTASQVMTPLARVSRVGEEETLAACYGRVCDSGHVRLPVFSADGARCVGVINALEVLALAPDPGRTPVRDCMTDPFFVEDTVRADDVLPLMRKHRRPLVMVRAVATGEVLGIITEENILNALTGSLQASARDALANA